MAEHQVTKKTMQNLGKCVRAVTSVKKLNVSEPFNFEDVCVSDYSAAAPFSYEDDDLRLSYDFVYDYFGSDYDSDEG
jgi:hypothetical protein